MRGPRQFIESAASHAIGAVDVVVSLATGPARVWWDVARSTTDRSTAQAVALRDANIELVREHAIVTMLQDAMRPDPPAVPSVEIAARYLPAGRFATVGGDWFDAFAVDDDRLILVVGDIAGHGIGAAAAMAQVRNAIRGCAFAGLDPGRILATVGTMLLQTSTGLSATCVVGSLSSSTNILTWASAGHPPPLLAHANGDTRFLTDRPGPPLPFPGADYGVHTHLLPLSSSLILYTDGLVERRDEPIDLGLNRLRALAEANGRQGVQRLANLLIEQLLRGGTPEDDVCVLVVRPVGS
jgi:serine phosphatase RsbU (regulator of sigma subunit)